MVRVAGARQLPNCR